ncbi:putative toxin-antitoxin system toxin component, PIN family [bacterium]|nr:putative toxin-antitoxin system toxin component, PIN family [bacterium]
MIKIVCDTNIYLSSLISTEGPPDELLSLARKEKIVIYISSFIISEIEQVLQKKILMEKTVIQGVIKEIRGFTQLVTPKVTVEIIKKKVSDNRILECAIEANADFLVSGDKKYLLPLKKHKKIKIVSPAEFLKTTNL